MKIEEYAVKLDHWIACVEGVSADGVTEDGARELVVSNLEAAMTGFSGKLMLCGGASREVIDSVGNALHTVLPSVDIRCSGDMLFDYDRMACLKVKRFISEKFVHALSIYPAIRSL